jgi:hypothetical protein
MNIEEMSKRFGLVGTEIEHIKSYMEKAKKAEVVICKDHGLEHYDFEECYACVEDKLWWDYEHGDHKAGDILKKSGRLSEGVEPDD